MLVDFGELLGFRPSDVVQMLDVDPFEFWLEPVPTCSWEGCEESLLDLDRKALYCPEHSEAADQQRSAERQRKRRAGLRARGEKEPRSRSGPASDGDPLVSDGLDILRKRGVSEAVQAARGYRRYAKGASWVVEEFRAAGDPTVNLATVARIVNQSEGWLIPKHPIPDAPAIAPQLRPDEPVFTNPTSTWHWHGETRDDPRTGPFLSRRTKSGAVHRVPVLRGRAAEQHIGAVSDEPYDWRTGEGSHRGENPRGFHRHAPHRAKYVLLGKGKRIDVHPLALERLPAAEVVYFGIEGSIKTDAILSAGGVAFGVPSVTMWPRRELRWFAERHLQGKTIVIVPDADWAIKPAVAWQALKLRTFLRQCEPLGRWVFVAAPPVALDLKGIDDYLGHRDGHALDELVLMGREPDYGLIWDATAHVRGRSRAVAERMLEMAILVADDDGRLADDDGPLRFGGYGSMAIADKWQATARALDSLRDVLQVDGSLEIETITETIRDENQQERQVQRHEFKQTPSITVPERHRASRTAPMTLRDLHEIRDGLEDFRAFRRAFLESCNG